MSNKPVSGTASKKNVNRKAKTTKATGDFVMPDYLRSQLRLFFTADIIGSTAYKQKHSESNKRVDAHVSLSTADERRDALHPTWFRAIGDFYDSAPEVVSEEWDDLVNRMDNSTNLGDAPTFWKAIGDELCFTKRIEHQEQALACIHVFNLALAKIRATLKKQSTDLDIKACAWIAEFPVMNTEVVFPSRHVSGAELYKKNYNETAYNALSKLKDFHADKDKATIAAKWIRDFVGPSIDTGFRIAAKATSRKLIISIELAYLLARASKDLKEKGGKSAVAKTLGLLPIMYDGRESLKGVMGGNPYPIFWLDTESDGARNAANTAENLLLHKVQTGDGATSVIAYCEEFFKLHDQYITKPYIVDKNQESIFGEMSDSHAKKYQVLKNLVFNFEKVSKIQPQLNQGISNPVLGDKNLKKNDATLQI